MNILENTRSRHEDLERFQKVLRETLDENPKTFRDGIQQAHIVSTYLKKTIECANDLAKIYEDLDNARKEEIANIMGTGPALYSNFYDKLKDLRNYHRQYPDINVETAEDRAYFEVEIPPFTGEEGWGRYLDLHEIHMEFVNLPSTKKLGITQDYYTYLDHFYKFGNDTERDASYKKYLEHLYSYVISFIERSQPLTELQPVLKEVEGVFNTKSQSEEFIQEHIRSSNPLHCKTCLKTFSKDTVFKSHLKGAKHIKAMEVVKDCVSLEFRINFICGKLLMENISSTKIHVEKKMSKNPDEWEDEEEVEQVIEEVGDEEEVEIRTTKENYPVGWDGKPIPYWLYKLHGLGVEYRCEICGNASYFGRKAYECHFQEWRHAHGMKCLGIPNIGVFKDITKINDALLLWEKIKRDNTGKDWNPEHEEECEDKEGNVYSRKVYLDLKRQGLLP